MANDDIELIHNFAHDLKTPLSAAKSFIDLLGASGELNEKQEHFAHRAQTNILRAFDTIEALLEYARMESDALNVDVVDLLHISNGVVEMVESIATEQQVSIDIDVDPEAQFVNGDEHMIGHVITNLVSNAIKYNHINGTVRIVTKNEGEFVRVSVIDTGLGIPEKDIEHIFKRFYRVEEKSHKSIPGTGIGLAVVRSVVEKHGGIIYVESEEGKGSTFTFTLPHASVSSTRDYNREPTDGVEDHFQEARDEHDESDAGEV